jgi:hypothetical protein
LLKKGDYKMSLDVNKIIMESLSEINSEVKDETKKDETLVENKDETKKDETLVENKDETKKDETLVESEGSDPLINAKAAAFAAGLGAMTLRKRLASYN